ncbi:MAG: response regulator [Rhodothermales bacterium]
MTILLVEDNLAHAELVRRSFEEHQVINEIYHVSDGEAAIDYLFRQGTYADPERSPRPHIILLDLRLPKIDGLEVLTQIKSDDTLRAIPVIILTTSSAEQDINRAYSEHVNSYLVKPVNFGSFTQLMKEIGYYWLGWNCHPRE